MGDAICNGGSAKREDKGEFAIFTENEQQNMSYEKFLRHELECMNLNAFKVSD